MVSPRSIMEKSTYPQGAGRMNNPKMKDNMSKMNYLNNMINKEKIDINNLMIQKKNMAHNYKMSGTSYDMKYKEKMNYIDKLIGDKKGNINRMTVEAKFYRD